MFWKKKKKESSSKTSREELIAQAKANAAKARAEIGDETLQKIVENIRKKEQSATEQAKAKIRAMDQDKVADHIKLMLDEKE
ncbi:MAG: hypothetical protein HY370_06120 [Proteobacteria bacterium]|nr:hypothetical protein [Pseudomonadota bacterium]